jgi:hypothetical protein
VLLDTLVLVFDDYVRCRGRLQAARRLARLGLHLPPTALLDPDASFLEL